MKHPIKALALLVLFSPFSHLGADLTTVFAVEPTVIEVSAQESFENVTIPEVGSLVRPESGRRALDLPDFAGGSELVEVTRDGLRQLLPPLITNREGVRYLEFYETRPAHRIDRQFSHHESRFATERQRLAVISMPW